MKNFFLLATICASLVTAVPVPDRKLLGAVDAVDGCSEDVNSPACVYKRDRKLLGAVEDVEGCTDDANSPACVYKRHPNGVYNKYEGLNAVE